LGCKATANFRACHFEKMGTNIVKFALRITGLLFVITTALIGCKKQEQSTTTSHVLDASRLRPAFASSSPEALALVNDVMTSIQGSNSAKARSDLDQLANMPGVTAAQKAVVKDLSDQLDKKIALDAAAAAAPK
jgi:hypothetical protein